MNSSNRNRWLLAAAVLIGAAPAQADITAHYANAAGTIAFTAEADAKGDVRIGYGNQYAVLKRDGVTYVLMGDLSGPFAVKLDDWNAVNVAKMRQFIRSTGPNAGAAKAVPDFKGPEFVVVRGGQETVGGRTGTVWSLKPKDSARPPANEVGFDFVVSTDPDLAPIGQLLAAQMTTSANGMREIMGNSPDMFEKIADVFAKGTMIRMSKIMSLQSVDAKPIPSSEFDLPATILTREQYEARSQPAPASVSSKP